MARLKYPFPYSRGKKPTAWDECYTDDDGRDVASALLHSPNKGFWACPDVQTTRFFVQKQLRYLWVW